VGNNGLIALNLQLVKKLTGPLWDVGVGKFNEDKGAMVETITTETGKVGMIGHLGPCDHVEVDIIFLK
jgi:hypothetical protein